MSSALSMISDDQEEVRIVINAAVINIIDLQVKRLSTFNIE